MAYTVRNLANDALLEIGVVDPVETLDDEDAEVALRYVQLMADSMNADRLMLFTETLVPFVLTSNQATNTVGVGAQFDTTASLGATAPRPFGIGPGLVTPVGDDVDYPLVPYDRRQAYYNEPLKTLTELYPRRFLYEPSWPNGLLTWWPVPTTAATVKLPLPVPLTAPATLATVLSFPPGYKELWKLALSRRLCRPFRKRVTQELKDDLKEAYGLVKRLNDGGPPPARCDGFGGRHYDIISNRLR